MIKKPDNFINLDDWSKYDSTYFVASDECKRRLEQIAEQLHLLCDQYDIPFALNVCVEQNAEGSIIIHGTYIPKDLGKTSAAMLCRMSGEPDLQNYISQHVAIWHAGEQRRQALLNLQRTAAQAPKQ